MPHRRSLLDLLARYAESGRMVTEEHDGFARIRSFVESEPGCFNRATVAGHITGSAWILNDQQTCALLTHHKKLGLWLQPGGHADGESDILQVALREGIEESGIGGLVAFDGEVYDVDVHAIPANPREPGHFHYDVRFAFRAPADAQFVVGEESHDLAWAPLDTLGDYNTDESVLRLGRKWKRR